MDILRHTAKEILALATLELFPDALLVGGDVDEIGFSYHFVFPKNVVFSERELRMIEDHMGRVIYEDRPIKQLEMMRENAITFLEHNGQPLIAEEAGESPENIVSLCEIGAFRDLSPQLLESTKGVKAFKLQGFEAGEVVRIYGTAFEEKQALKDYLKQYRAAEKNNPLVRGPKEGYFLPFGEEWIYLEKGVRVLEKLKDFWEKEHPEFTQVAFSDALDPREVHGAVKGAKVASFSPFKGDLATIKCKSLEELEQAKISSLHFFEKAFKIFAFETTYDQSSGRFFVRDGYGRSHELAYIKVERKERVLHRSLFASPQTWVAHWIEKRVEI